MIAHPVLDHSIVHGDFHAGRVRIVHNDDVQEAISDFRLLFPHDTVLTTAIGCCHTCVYSDNAPASLVAERIAQHIREVDHSVRERRPRPDTSRKHGLGKEVWW